MSRTHLIKRLEGLLTKYPDFYETHPELKEQILIKIENIRTGHYAIKNANYVIGYVGGKIRDTQMFTKTTKGCSDKELLEHAKKVCNEIKKGE